MKNIKILGAGISGLTAAINLVKEGFNVEVYEKNPDVGMRFSGDLVALENWSEKKDILKELKECQIKINFDCVPFSHLLTTNCEKTKKLKSERAFFYLVKRGPASSTLDHGLKEQALELGVKIYFNKTTSHDSVDIVATGPLCKDSPALNKGIAFKTNQKDLAIVVFNNELAFKGYSYLLITNGYGCMYTLVLDELKRVNICFEKTMSFFKKKFNLDIKSPIKVGGIGNFSLKCSFKKGSTLYVGEAAGLQDFLWGFGIRFAFISGYLAAKSIINSQAYDELATKRFRHKMQAGIVNRYLWEKMSKNNYSFILSNMNLIQRNLFTFHNFNILQGIIYPLALFSLKKRYKNL